MIIGCFIAGLSLFIVGPSTLLHLPNSLTLMIFGQAIVGFFLPFCFIPALPEMTESIESVFSKKQLEDVNNISSGIFNAFLGIG